MRASRTLIYLSLVVVVGGAFSPQSLASRNGLKKELAKALSSTPDAADPDPSGMPRGGGGGLSSNVDPLPTMKDYRKFAVPCLGLWVAGPLLSLIDTAFVGLSGDPSLSAAQLAALGPATTFFDGATYLFAFLNVATTNLYSSARAQYGEDNPKTESVVRTAARISLICGFIVMGLLMKYSRTLLGIYIGKSIGFLANAPISTFGSNRQSHRFCQEPKRPPTQTYSTGQPNMLRSAHSLFQLRCYLVCCRQPCLEPKIL